MTNKTLKIALGFFVFTTTILSLAFYLAVDTIGEKNNIMFDNLMESERYKNEIKLTNNRLDYLDLEIQKLAGFKLLEIEYEQKLNNLEVVGLINKNAAKVSHLPINTALFYFSNNHCNSCFENELKIINDYHNNNPTARVAILTSVENNRQLALLKSSYNITPPIYRIINLTAADLPSFPTYFAINKDNQLRHFLIANENRVDLSKQYLQFINLRK